MRELRFQKNTGCLLQVIEFDDGQVVAVWISGAVHEVAIYKNLTEFLSIRTTAKGYKKYYDSKDAVRGCSCSDCVRQS